MPFFAERGAQFNLLGDGTWRRPQLGALGAILASWSLGRPEPTLVSIPTGSGKTAVALAAPFLLSSSPRRVLVLAPSQQLRRQLAEHFQSYTQLIARGVLPSGGGANVREIVGRVENWADLEPFDVVVGLPNSVSPVHYEVSVAPPKELFDLVIVDEAHHAPARTWLALLDHFPAPALLLTATPKRRDGQRIPGSLDFYYPLRRAMEEGIYQPIEPALLPPGASRRESDERIAAAATSTLGEDRHASSILLVRAGNVQRLTELREIYHEAGLELSVLHNGLSKSSQNTIVDGMRAGRIRAVGVVGMLGEGFDLPAIRIVAYHDKHKSLPATVQLIGRLARVDARFPQPSRLVTVNDIDVYPELRGVLRELYEEDADWSLILPGLLDAEVAREQADRSFAAGLPESISEIDPLQLAPIKRALVYELPADWEPPFLRDLAVEFGVGGPLLGGRILYSGVVESAGMLVVVVRYIDRPRWSTDPALADTRYELHVAIFRKAPRRDLPGLFLLNTDRPGARRTLERLLGLDAAATLAGPDRLGPYLDSLDRGSVSSVGIRSTNAATRGRATYRNYMGSGVDRGIRSVDVARSALGHAMFQVRTATGAANAGAAIEKSKIWMTVYGPLRELSEWADETARLLWFPQQTAQGPLLPGVERGHRLEAWPRSRPLAAEMSPHLLGLGLVLRGPEGVLGPIEDLDLYVNRDPTETLGEIEESDAQILAMVGVLNDRDAGQERCIWRGSVDPSGRVIAEQDVEVQRGFGAAQLLSEVLEQAPPTIYFLDGTTTIGPVRYDSRRASSSFDLSALRTTLWDDVDITAETRATAAGREAGTVSIHEHLEGYLRDLPRLGERRWILCNDGSGEIADYLVIEELASGEIALSLWHAKAASGSSPSVRIADFQVVVAQAIRSRSSLPSTGLWAALGRRLGGTESPAATLVGGSDDVLVLRHRLGLEVDDDRPDTPSPWTRSLPAIRGTIGIAQPGLSAGRLRDELEQAVATPGASGLLQLFSLLQDAAISDGADLRLLVSP
jgi:superfamily II DNA or RNA helicase